MAWFATLLAHLLVLFLIIAVPVRGARRYRVLMRRSTGIQNCARAFMCGG